MLTDETDSKNFFNDALTVNYIDKYLALGMSGWIYVYWRPKGKGTQITSAHYEDMTSEDHLRRAEELKVLAGMEKKNADIFRKLRDKKRRARSIRKSLAYEEAARHHELKANGDIEEEFYVDEEEALISNLREAQNILKANSENIGDLMDEMENPK